MKKLAQSSHLEWVVVVCFFFIFWVGGGMWEGFEKITREKNEVK